MWSAGIHSKELFNRCKRRAWYGFRWFDSALGFESRLISYFIKDAPTDEEIVSRLNAGGIELDKSEFRKLKDFSCEVYLQELPPDKISSSPSAFECRKCEFLEYCHHAKELEKVPAVNCRTCAHITFGNDGFARCEEQGRTLTIKDQWRGCESHLFNPHALPFEALEARNDGVVYLTVKGEKVINVKGGRFEKYTR